MSDEESNPYNMFFYWILLLFDFFFLIFRYIILAEWSFLINLSTGNHL